MARDFFHFNPHQQFEMRQEKDKKNFRNISKTMVKYKIHTYMHTKSVCCRLPSLYGYCSFHLTFCSLFFFFFTSCLCFHISYHPIEKKKIFYSLFYILFFCMQICICMLLFRLFIFSILRINVRRKKKEIDMSMAAAGSERINVEYYKYLF